MRLPSHPLRWLVSACAVTLLAAAAAATPSVDAAIEPQQITLGESAQLTISTSGSGTLSVPLPVVPGLEFRVVGQSRQVQIINGTSFESTSTLVRVTPEEAGIFTIPSMSPKSPPLVLRVTPSNGSGSSAPNPGGSQGQTPLLPGAGGANGIRLTADGSAFVRLGIPKHEIYVGESIPVEIQVGLRDGFVASINGLPKLNSSDFTLNNLSNQPERSAKIIDGKQYTLLTWRTLLAAVKPGTFSVDFETPLTVKIRRRPQGDSMLDDLLGDPFMQNFFGMTVPKNITVTSPATAFTVLALPTQGRPADFGGAVGNFKIGTDISSATAAAGDPLTLRMHVSGAGNFDRVDSSMLHTGGEWKTYDPKATFKATDPVGYRGEKTFEQPLIATKSGPHTVPPLAFSFFNPDTRRYETVHSAPLNVTVTPSAAEYAANQAPPPANSAAAPAGEAPDGLRPDHPVTGSRASTLLPPYFQPRYLAIPSVFSLLFAAGWMALRRRERNAGDSLRARERARSQRIRSLLETMSAASGAGNAALFLTSARSALQHDLSARWQIAPEQVTLEEIDARLGADADHGEIRQIFALADEANYSGHAPNATDFDRWTQVVGRRTSSEQPS
ncbi:MAG TPA: BatD family protein [Steroidobacteraceae bacterium]|nr:BatD family protein [Steroidobacteraceae bacterium]